MLTDKDFDEIGKRLYDLEADPPAKGWKKIASDLDHPDDPEKGGFFSRHRWKPLLLVIPVIIYLMWPSNNVAHVEPDNASLQEEVTGQNRLHTDGHAPSTQEFAGPNETADPAANTPSLSQGTTKAGNGTELNNALNSRAPRGTHSTRNEAEERNETGVNSNDKPADAINSPLSQSGHELASTNKEAKIRPESESEAGLEQHPTTDTSDEDEPELAGSNASPLQEEQPLKDTERNQPLKKGDDSYQTSQSKMVAEAALVNIEPSTSSPAPGNLKAIRRNDTPTEDQSEELRKSERETSTANDELFVREQLDTASEVETPESKLRNQEKTPAEIAVETSPVSQPTVSPGSTESAELSESIARQNNKLNMSEPATIFDSVAHTQAILPVPANESPAEEITEDEASEKIHGPWRINVGFTPQFSYQAIRPDGSDEVLVTSYRTGNTSYPERIGFGFALGAGKAVLENLYVDAQLTFSKTKQDIAYSYATGVIDTLLAQQQPDGNVNMVPVYVVNSSEKSASYSYGGIRLIGTYYFWSKPTRRFSFTTGISMNYLLSTTLNEKVGGVWINRDNPVSDRMNYIFTLGAGYNVTLGKGLELMMSPMINHYLKKIESEGQPFNISQRSYGLNIMLSKSLY